MSSPKIIEAIIPPPPAHMVGDGFRVHTFFPGVRFNQRRMSPFFMLDYGSKIDFSASVKQRGVGVHPHAGFETVTIAYHGKIAHHDSAGNQGIIGEGDVQWMTAGAGLLHKEYHEENFSKTGGLFQMVQLWVNLPAKHKKTAPKYQEILNEKMGKAVLENNGGTVEIIAGEYAGTKGPAFTFSPIEMYNIKLNKGAAITLPLPAHYNTGLLVIEGNVEINDNTAPTDHFVLFKNEGETITIQAKENSIVLLLSGEPINEPIAAYGPFVMNTWEEVEKAIEDANRGKYGVLADD
jgi:redox-sensitive bicupin YhaK (pirin superfamily)